MFAVQSAKWGMTPGNYSLLLDVIEDKGPGALRYGIDIHDAAKAAQVACAPALYLVPTVVIPEGWAFALVGPWELDRSVVLRQNLLLASIETESGGFYARKALAELARDANPVPGAYQVRRFDDGRAVIFAPYPEIEALRAAVAMRLWTEMQDTDSVETLQALVARYSQIMESEEDFLRVTIGALVLYEEVPPEVRAVLTDDSLFSTEERIAFEGKAGSMLDVLNVHRKRRR